MMHTEDKRTLASREHEFGGLGDVRELMGLCEEMQSRAIEPKAQVVDKHVGKLVSLTRVRNDEGL